MLAVGWLFMDERKCPTNTRSLRVGEAAYQSARGYPHYFRNGRRSAGAGVPRVIKLTAETPGRDGILHSGVILRSPVYSRHADAVRRAGAVGDNCDRYIARRQSRYLRFSYVFLEERTGIDLKEIKKHDT